MESYTKMAQATTEDTGVMTIVKKWRKDDGTIWYITFYRSSISGDSLSLIKISKNDSIREGFWVNANISGSEGSLVEANLTPTHPHYKIYRR
jgi:hypothetical protein